MMRRVAGPIALVVMLISGCGDEATGTTVEAASLSTGATPPFPPSPSPPSPTPVDEKQAVVRQFVRYLATTDDLAGDARVTRARLTTVMTEAFAAKVLPGFRQNQRNGLRHRGRTVFSGETVTVTGDEATLRACVDQSKKRLSTQDGRPVDNPFRPATSTVSMTQVAGVWKVADVTPGGAC